MENLFHTGTLPLSLSSILNLPPNCMARDGGLHTCLDSLLMTVVLILPFRGTSKIRRVWGSSETLAAAGSFWCGSRNVAAGMTVDRSNPGGTLRSFNNRKVGLCSGVPTSTLTAERQVRLTGLIPETLRASDLWVYITLSQVVFFSPSTKCVAQVLHCISSVIFLGTRTQFLAPFLSVGT